MKVFVGIALSFVVSCLSGLLHRQKPSAVPTCRDQASLFTEYIRLDNSIGTDPELKANADSAYAQWLKLSEDCQAKGFMAQSLRSAEPDPQAVRFCKSRITHDTQAYYLCQRLGVSPDSNQQRLKDAHELCTGLSQPVGICSDLLPFSP